ncbi:MAG: Flp family type IVb pilin [Bacillota bacterium]|nr:Flp family type IVb pilin [Bacillota bacterium]
MQTLGQRAGEAARAVQVRTRTWLRGVARRWQERGRDPYGGQRGVSTAEYALLLALVVVVLITALSTLGAELRNRIVELTNTIVGAQVPGN